MGFCSAAKLLCASTLTKGRIAGGIFTSQSGTMQSAAAVALMPLLIFWCVHRNNDSMLFSGPHSPRKLPLPVGGTRPHLIRGSLGSSATQTASRSVQPSVCRAHEREKQTDRHITLLRPSVAISRIAAMRPNSVRQIMHVGTEACSVPSCIDVR